MDPVIIVHGGAGDIPDWQVKMKMDGGRKAAIAGYEILLNNGTVIDAVEAAVKVMEDDTAFIAGPSIESNVLHKYFRLISKFRQ